MVRRYSERREQEAIIYTQGFAHGFHTPTDIVEFTYKCSDYYHPEDEGGIIWNDSDIAVEWPLEEYGINEPLLSEKDQKWPTLKG